VFVSSFEGWAPSLARISKYSSWPAGSPLIVAS
jgi:hypothetical protein